MHKLIIYGVSDDLIEIDGDFSEEIGCCMDSGDDYFLSLSDGTLLEVEYSQAGVWRFRQTLTGNGTAFSKVEAPEDDENNYSDVVTLKAAMPFKWALLGKQLALAEARVNGGEQK